MSVQKRVSLLSMLIAQTPCGGTQCGHDAPPSGQLDPTPLKYLRGGVERDSPVVPLFLSPLR